MHLIVFLTPGTSLHDWHRLGIFRREVAIYESLQQKGVSITFITYGDRSDLKYSDSIPGIKILCNRWGLPVQWYSRLLPVLHAWDLARATVYKTNQSKGAEVALRAARIWQKPLVARNGFLRSDFSVREHGEQSSAAMKTRTLEQKIFESAHKIVVTTKSMKRDVIQIVPEAASRTVIIPNYVDISLFTPQRNTDDGKHLIFVGRVEPQKNLEALLEAIEPLDLRLTVIGSGSLTKTLQTRFNSLKSCVDWRGNVSHTDLPSHIQEATLFVLPSHYEGHPKALIEAMACGIPVIGADSPGIRELIQHGKNGWLCKPDPDGIRSAITELISLPEVRSELGLQARNFAVKNFSLDKILEMELAMLQEVSKL